MTVHLWRVASDTPSWPADDMIGKSAASKGARWNHPGELVTYAATSISLAAWETRAHFGRGTTLPWNRFLVRIDLPDETWAAREVVSRPLPVGWDAIPERPVSRNLGSSWLKSGRTSLLTVPSVIIDGEDNVMVNPAHPDCARIRATKVWRFLYDHRV